jgi:hypothetical protein
MLLLAVMEFLSVPLQEVHSVCFGVASGAFSKKKKWIKFDQPWLCFSLIGDRRSADFIAIDERQAIEWVLAFQALLGMPLEHRMSKGRLLWMRASMRTAMEAAKSKRSLEDVISAALLETEIQKEEEEERQKGVTEEEPETLEHDPNLRGKGKDKKKGKKKGKK